MEFMGTKEASRLWDIPQKALSRMCSKIKSPGRSRTAKEVRGGFPGMQKDRNIEEERRK